MTGIRKLAELGDRTWMLDPGGHCLNTTVDMHPDDTAGVARAIAVCKPPDMPNCPVLDRCLAYALEHGEKYGVWGGESQRSRERIVRRGRQRARVGAA